MLRREKWTATIRSQCRVRDSFHVVFRLRSGRRFDIVPLQDRGDGAAGKIVPHVELRILDASVYCLWKYY
jgi:hypothetical protein